MWDTDPQLESLTLMFTIANASTLDLAVLELVRTDAAQAGYKFVDRLCNEWVSGTNRFDREGEALFLAYAGDQVIGVCGVNRDPYAEDSRVGRVRRLYVLSTYRGRGVGRQLVNVVIAHARSHFDRLRVRTDAANDFYIAGGFQRVDDDAQATHELLLA